METIIDRIGSHKPPFAQLTPDQREAVAALLRSLYAEAASGESRPDPYRGITLAQYIEECVQEAWQCGAQAWDAKRQAADLARVSPEKAAPDTSRPAPDHPWRTAPAVKPRPVAATPSASGVAERIEALVRDRGEVTTGELLEELGLQRGGSFERAKNELLDQGHIRMVRRGTFAPGVKGDAPAR